MLIASLLFAAAVHGTVTELDVDSRILGRARHVWVYTPAGYEGACRADDGCSLVIAFDGGIYASPIMALPDVLDSLIASRAIKPTIAVMIENGGGSDRIGDLGNRAVFTRFLAEELMPLVRARYPVTRSPQRTVVAGSSAGGLAAAHAALAHPELFGNVLSQSGAFWRGNEASNSAPFEWLTSQYSAAPKKPIRFVLDVGSAETVGAMGGAAPSLLEANRHLRDALAKRGYSVDYREIPGGKHDPSDWARRLPSALASLLSP